MDVTRAYPRRPAIALLAVATAIGSLGLAAGGTAGALIAMEMTGSAASAGLPLGLLVVGSAAGAILVSRRSQHAGRASGLTLGYGLGAVGAAAVIVGAVASSFGVVLAGSFTLGAANAAVFLSRYAAADLAGDAVRGRALGVVLAAAAVGAVASPNLLGPSGELASQVGLPHLTGLYLVAVPAFWIAGALMALLPRRSVAGEPRPSEAASMSTRDAVRNVRVRLALAVLASTNLVMVATMAVAPVHLTAHGHSLDRVGAIVSVHVLGMFAPAPLSGWLADRIGGAAVAAVGAAILVTAGVAAAIADASDGVVVAAALAVLGIGWNAGVVGGSTMLMAAVPRAARPRAEGIGELAMGVAAGAGAPVAGLIVAVGSFGSLAVAGAAVSALALMMLRFASHVAPAPGKRASAALEVEGSSVIPATRPVRRKAPSAVGGRGSS